MEVRTKISIVNDKGSPFMGPGILRLLSRIDELKSINRAAKEMRLSYVKALNLLNRLENEVGEALLIRTRGGKHQGGTLLTDRGKAYIKAYAALEKRLRKHADREFDRFVETVKKENP